MTVASSGNTVEIARIIDSQPYGRAQMLIAALCGLVALLDGFDLQAIGLAAPAIVATMKITPPELGTVFSSALAGLAIGAFFLGPVADRFGRKHVLIATVILFGAATLLTATAASLNELRLYRFLTGLGLGGAMPSFIALGAEYAPERLRKTVVAVLWAGFPLGGVVGGLLGSWLIPAEGWRAMFWVGGTLPLLVAPALLFLPESAGYLAARQAPADRIAALLKRIFPGLVLAPDASFVTPLQGAGGVRLGELFAPDRRFGTAMLWVSFFIAFMLLVTNTAWSPILLRNVGLDVSRSSLAMAAFNFASVIGSSAAGWLISRYGSLAILPASFVITAIAFVFVGQGAPDQATVTAAEAVIGLTLGCASSGLIVLAATFYPTAIRSTGVGWAMGLGRFGSFVGPLVVGSLAGALLPITTIFIVIGAASLIAAPFSALVGGGRRSALVTEPVA